MFFYANRNGSRVFFDDLGPPWPKHPCTDTGMAQPSDGRAPSRHDFSAGRRSSELRDRSWKSYAVKEVVVDGEYSRIVLHQLDGTGRGPSWTVAGTVPLRVDDIVFTRAKQMSYFDAGVGGAVVVEDARQAAGLARQLITERDRLYVIAGLQARVAAGEMTAWDMGTAAVGIRAARTRGELAAALKIKVTDLKVAPARPGDVLMLAIGFVLMVAVTSTTNGPHAYLVMLPGLLLVAAAVFRLNPGLETGPRVLLAVMTTLVMICPAGCIGGAIQVEILQR
ncbi:MAG TPA: hypothetical protein VN408_20445 [Actinoplanes sp.]|nr:hypothetical protein [Actinoplanes sp.]